jgi:hypothetical protein
MRADTAKKSSLALPGEGGKVEAGVRDESGTPIPRGGREGGREGGRGGYIGETVSPGCFAVGRVGNTGQELVTGGVNKPVPGSFWQPSPNTIVPLGFTFCGGCPCNISSSCADGTVFISQHAGIHTDDTKPRVE